LTASWRASCRPGVSWNAVLEGGGALVSNKVTLELALVAVRPS
jgi:hypothetical protein